MPHVAMIGRSTHYETNDEKKWRQSDGPMVGDPWILQTNRMYMYMYSALDNDEERLLSDRLSALLSGAKEMLTYLSVPKKRGRG